MDNGGLLGALPGPSSLDTLGAAALYAVVLGFVFVECALLVGFLLPGDTLLVAAGVAAHSSHQISLGWLVAGVFVAAVAGEVIGYLIGARAGLALLQRRNGRVVNPRNIARAEAFSARYGVFAIIAARWIPWLRTFAPLLAGATRMPWLPFMVANVVGALCWAPLLILVGYLAASIPALRNVSLVLAVAAVVVALTAGLFQYWRTTHRHDGADEGNRTGRTDRIDQAERTDQAERADQAEPADHGDHTDHTERAAGTGGADVADGKDGEDGKDGKDGEDRNGDAPKGPVETVNGNQVSGDPTERGDRHSLDSRER